MKDKSYKRHIAKSITWRAVGTLDTFLLSWFISGSPFIGFKIGVSEIITKMFLYYFHERLWFKMGFKGAEESKKRHLAKTVTWRIIGTIDTMILAWIISGDSMIGVKVGLAEVVTKMVLYYLHERSWYRVNYGLSSRRNREVGE